VAGLASPEFVSAMKEFYLGPLNQQVVKAHVFLDRAQKSSEYVNGEYAYVPLITGRNPGVGSRADTAGVGPSLPDAGRQTYNAATFKMTLHYARGQISGPVMRASKTSAGAFAQALDVEMQGIMETVPEDLNRQIWSYGHGRAATLLTTSASGVTFSMDATSHFNVKVGDRVHFADIAAGTGWAPATGTTVAAITRDSAAGVHQIVLTAATGRTVTTAADALYFGAGAASLTAADVSRATEMFGIPAYAGTGNVGAEETTVAAAGEFVHANLQFGNIDRTAAANASWRAQWLRNPVTPGTNRALTNTVLQHAWLTAITVGGADSKSIEIFTNPGLWMTLGLLHIGDRRYSDYQDTLEGGWEFLKYNGSKVFYDRDAPRDIMWFLNMKDVLILSQSGYEFMDEDGAVLFRVANKDAYEFTLYKDIQLGAKRCSTAVRLDDLTTAANIEATI